MKGLLEWLESTPWSIALLESLWVWPLVETAHVLTLTIFFGTVVMNDLRLLGWTMKSVPVSEVTKRLLPWTRVGFVVMVITGAVIFYSNPVRYYHNIFFRFKVLLLIVAGLNAFVFHRGIHRKVAQWGKDLVLPREARIAGAISLIVWVTIIMAGRLIAYNWFDCDIQPQPGFVNWAAGCLTGAT